MTKRFSITVLATLTILATHVVASLPAAQAALPLEFSDGKVPTLAPMLREATPAVVNIATRGHVRVRQNPLFADPFFRRFFDLPNMPRQRQTQSVGSGVIVDAERGIVLTNNHVIANADKIVVTLRDKRQFAAKLVGTDPDTDIAVLEIPAENLTALPMGDSDALEVGDFVIAIGNPFGIGQTVTSGIVSALRRSGLGIEGFEDFIQTDASINPGNSGGPLVTLRGELIGINTAIIGPSGGNVGIGLAIPINMARRIMEQLVAYGEVSRGRLGVQAQDLTPDLAEAMGLDRTEGAIITSIVPGSPAAKAGLKAGDVITAVGGARIHNATQMRNKVGLLRVGETVALAILRDGEPMTIRAEIAEPTRVKVEAKGAARRLSGAMFAPLGEDSPLFGYVEGVFVAEVEPGSPAWRIGLRKDDVIVAVNRKRVRNLQEFEAAVTRRRGAMLLNIRRGDAQIYIAVR
ncbi:MAG: DegQ family serine endoprotease [Alphaproteobacteria bacterium]